MILPADQVVDHKPSRCDADVDETGCTKRQVCWAHLRRDFQAMIDRKDAGSAIGEDLLVHAAILLDRWRKVRVTAQPASKAAGLCSAC